VHLKGWAVESRVYAEDPERGFLPSTGRLVKYQPPQEMHADGITVRNDTGVYEGGEISIHYDPMIAKLVTHAGDRAAAIDAHAKALDEFVIDGIRHNIPFLSALMLHPRWREGALSTGFISEEFPDGFSASMGAGREAMHVLASVAASVDHVLNERKRQISGQMQTQRLVSFQRERSVIVGDERIDLRIDDTGGELLIRFDDGSDHAHHIESDWRPGQILWQGTVDDDAVAVQVRPILNGFLLSHGGVRLEARVFTRREAELAALMPVKQSADTSKKLLCPMPGLVRSIQVAEGQEVKAGEPLCIVEAMKMENVLRAERDGTVLKIHAAEGDSLPVDAVIMEFE
jgi:propionyl-CoA carboxylase alpha chain